MERRLKGQLILDFSVFWTQIPGFLAWVRFQDPTNAAATVIHTLRWKAQYRSFEPVGLRIGGDVSRVQPGIPDPVHGLNVSEKVTVPTFKVMAEVDKYFELSSHPGSGAMVIHSVEGTQPRSYSHHWMSRLRDLLVDVASGS
jgi:hypothetical protein